MSEINKLQVL